MIVSTVLDCLSMEAGEVIPAAKGRLTNVFKRATGFKGKFQWSVQSGVLKDGDNEIGIVFWGHPPVDAYKGKLIYLIGGTNDKGEPAGLTRDLSTSKDAKYDGLSQIKVEKEATISVSPPAGSGTQENNDNPDLDSQPPPEEKQPPFEKAGPMTLNDLDGEVRKYAMKIANTRVLAERAADYAVKAYKENHQGPSPCRTFSDEAVREIATGMFIEMCRNGVVSKMPGKKLTPLIPPEPPTPPKQTPPTQTQQPSEPPPEV